MKRLKALYLQWWVLIPGCWTLTGPEKVMGYEGKSLSVQCNYEKSFKNNIKFWCKCSIVTLCSSLLIKSSEEDLVKKDRFSIRDHREQGYFEITMDKLKYDDFGTYQCGIERGVLNDRHYFEVTVSPEPKKPSTTSTATPVSEGSQERELYILIYCIIPLFLLLIAAVLVLFIISRKKKGLVWKVKEEIKLERTLNTANADSEQSIPHHHLGSDGTDFFSNVEVHPENIYEEISSQEKSPGHEDKVCYATVNISDQQHEFIYANTDFVPSPVLSKSQEVFYTEVAKRSTEQ